MNNKIRIVILVILLCGSLVINLQARPRTVEIKLGTPTPSGSPWNDILQNLAAEWREISNGLVVLKIFPNGIAGDEEDMIRKMRINTLQAAVVSGVGLNGISSISMILSMPFLIRSEQEFDYVFEKVKPDLEEDIRKAGFTMVGWTRAGWMYFFSRDPVVYPKDLRGQKLAAADTDIVMAPALKTLGYHTISLTMNEIMSALVSGMVDACYTVPLGAVAYQWFGIARHMADIPLAPAIGGVIVTNRTWERIPEEMRPRLQEAPDRAILEIHKLNTETEREVMKVMKEHGLQQHNIPEAAVEEWRSLFGRVIENLIDKVFTRENYEKVFIHLEAYRNRYSMN
jgi:TRAP-type C4-dicarboxylate transport system substrate-binding protein